MWKRNWETAWTSRKLCVVKMSICYGKTIQNWNARKSFRLRMFCLFNIAWMSFIHSGHSLYVYFLYFSFHFIPFFSFIFYWRKDINRKTQEWPMKKKPHFVPFAKWYRTELHGWTNKNCVFIWYPVISSLQPLSISQIIWGQRAQNHHVDNVEIWYDFFRIDSV